MTRQRDVVAVAPVVPMKLIEPIATPAALYCCGGISSGVAAVGADTSPFSGDGIIVAVLDTGIDATHPAFAGVTLVEKNFTSEASAISTVMAPTARAPSSVETRWNAHRHRARCHQGPHWQSAGAGGGSSDQIVSAIQWAVQNGAHVISMSLGMDFPGLVAQLVGQGFPPALATSRALEGYRLNVQLFERLASLVRVQGDFGEPTVIIAAAGKRKRAAAGS